MQILTRSILGKTFLDVVGYSGKLLNHMVIFSSIQILFRPVSYSFMPHVPPNPNQLLVVSNGLVVYRACACISFT